MRRILGMETSESDDDDSASGGDEKLRKLAGDVFRKLAEASVRTREKVMALSPKQVMVILDRAEQKGRDRATRNAKIRRPNLAGAALIEDIERRAKLSRRRKWYWLQMFKVNLPEDPALLPEEKRRALGITS